jgi:hypothetical protein
MKKQGNMTPKKKKKPTPHTHNQQSHNKGFGVEREVEKNNLNDSEVDEILNVKLKRVIVRMISETKEDMYKLSEFKQKTQLKKRRVQINS